MKKKKITINAPIVLGFVLVCTISMMLNWVTAGKSNELLFSVYHSSLTNPLTYIRMVTHVFGHANWSHYIGNITYLLLLGGIVEEKYGAKNILKIIVITAAVSGLIHYLFFTGSALCGASGIVFAFILLTSYTNFKEGELPITVILVALVFIGQQVYSGISTDENISYISHIIGGIIGAVLGYCWNKRK